MRRLTHCLAAAAVVGTPTVALATVIPPIIVPPPSTNYVMTGTYAKGCFPPCFCPILFTDDVTGSFTLTPQTFTLGSGGKVVIPDIVQSFAVSNVAINIGPPSPKGPHVTGSGLYQILSGITVTHRMQLDLTTGPDGAIEHFDSGWVVGGFEFPDIETVVSINGMKCFDTVFSISATPASPADLNLDGHVNGLDLAIMLGQWGPCPVCIVGPCPCPADLNGDSQINGLDIAILLGEWG